MIYSPDKFGFYTVGDIKTYSKIEALELQKRTGHFPQWNFNNEIFSQQDWTIEPSLDLWEIYKQRARQIRESYDYVVLMYSGGSDSHNLISAWLEADCKIDEIATQWNYAGTNDKQSFWNDEITTVALPIVEALKNHGLEFKFRLLDVSQDTQDIVINTHSDDYRYLANNAFGPNNYAKNLWRERIREYLDIIASGKKLCFLWGSEKPIFYWDQKYYLVFQDLIDNCVNTFTQLNYNQGWYDELFYWTPDLPMLPIKQAHVIKRFVETIHDPQFYQTGRTRYGYNKKLDAYLTERAIKLVLYPRWDDNTFISPSGKTYSTMLSKRDTWLIDGNTEAAGLYKNILCQLQKSVDTYWLNDNQTVLSGIKNCITQRYYIER